jgi:hypothetical protein
MVDASRPIGGVLFGLAFILVARKLQNREVKGYLVMTGIGFLLLLISYQAQALITAPFPPLGLLSGSYFGLASYTIFIGLYSSAISISEDSRLRVSIRKSVESEVRFVGSMGEAEMDRRILDKVRYLSTATSKVRYLLPSVAHFIISAGTLDFASSEVHSPVETGIIIACSAGIVQLYSVFPCRLWVKKDTFPETPTGHFPRAEPRSCGCWSFGI